MLRILHLPLIRHSPTSPVAAGEPRMDPFRRPAHDDYAPGPEAYDAPPFTTSVEPSPDGRWLAVVNLGDGASATKVCEDKAEAARYGQELLRWLGSRRQEE